MQNVACPLFRSWFEWWAVLTLQDYQLKGIKVDIQLLESLKTLSVAERIQLVEDLWDSIAITQEEFGLSEAQQIELKRRLDALARENGVREEWH